jgi:hypothetical protein
VEEIHIVGVPPAEVELLTELCGLSVFWLLASWDIVNNWTYCLDCGRDLNIGVMDVN